MVMSGMRHLMGATVAMIAASSAAAQSPTESSATASAKAKVVRRFVAPGVDEKIAYAELVDLQRRTSPADVVDVVADLVPTFGQSSGLQPMPMSEIRGQAYLFRFPNMRAVGAITEASDQVQGSSGRHACRIVMDPTKGAPPPTAFLVLSRWCMHAIALANIDPAAIDEP